MHGLGTNLLPSGLSALSKSLIPPSPSPFFRIMSLEMQLLGSFKNSCYCRIEVPKPYIFSNSLIETIDSSSMPTLLNSLKLVGDWKCLGILHRSPKPQAQSIFFRYLAFISSILNRACWWLPTGVEGAAAKMSLPPE
jgi:hypothetical protein